MRVPMRQRRMPVPVGVRLTGLHTRFVLMAVVFVVAVPMLVLHRLMGMGVLVPLGQMQPEADRHQAPGDHQLHRNRLAEHDDRQHRSHERRE